MGLCVFSIVDIAAAKQFIDFAVGNDGPVQGLGLFHGSAHHVVRLDASAVIGETDGIGSHAFQICQLFTLLPYGDGTQRIHMDAGGIFDHLSLNCQMLNAVGHRI